MPRVRISTTVDSERLARCRKLAGTPDSRMLDRALAAFEREAEAAHERAVLAEHPYEEDFELSWRPPPGPGLPYDAEVPKAVRAAAGKRRTGRR